MSDPKWEEVRTNAGWHLRLKGGNGEIVLTSEVYSNHEEVTNALAVVRKSVNNFTVHNPFYVDQRVKGYAVNPLPMKNPMDLPEAPQ